MPGKAGDLIVNIVVDLNQLKKGFKEAKKVISKYKNDIKGLSKGFFESKKAASEYNDGIKNISKTFVNVKTATSEYKADIDDIINKFGDAKKTTEDYDKEIENLSKGFTGSKKSASVYKKNIKSISTGLEKGKKILSDYKKSIHHFEMTSKMAFMNVGMAATAFGAIFTVALKKATGQALDYEKQLARVETMLRDDINTATNEIADNMERFDKELKKMSVEFGQSTEVLADGLYEALSAGKTAEEAIELLGEASSTASGQFTDTDKVMSILLTVMKSYGDELESVEQATDMLTNTVFLARTNMGEMAQQMGRIIPMGKQLGIPLNELLGLFSELTLSLGNSEKAVTTLQALLKMFVKPSQSAENAFALITKGLTGYSAQLDINTVKQLGFHNTLKLISGAEKTLAAEFFGSARALRGLDIIMDKHDSTVEKSKKILEDRNTTQELFNRTQDKTFFKIKKMEQQFKVVVVEIFETLLPTIKIFTESISSMAKFFSELSPETKTAIAFIAAFGTALFVVAGPMLLVIATLGDLKFVILGAITVFKALTAVLTPIIITFGFVIAKFIAVGVAGYALGTAIKWVLNKFFDFDKAVQNAIKSLVEFLGLEETTAANASGLAKKLDEVNKKYGIQARSLQEALDIIRIKNELSKKGIKEETDAIDKRNKGLKDLETLEDKIRKLKGIDSGEKETKKENKQQEDIAKLRRKVFIDNLELAGKEKEARLEELQDEFEERKKTLGKSLDLVKWFEASKSVIVKEFLQKDMKERENKLLQEKKKLDQTEQAERELIEKLGFSWKYYYDFKLNKINYLFNKEVEKSGNIEAAEQIRLGRIKELNKQRFEFQADQYNQDTEDYREYLSLKDEMDEDYYATVEELARRTGESQSEIIAQAGAKQNQTWSDALRGMQDASNDFTLQNMDLYGEMSNLVKNQFTGMVDGMGNAMGDFVNNAIQGNANLGKSFQEFAQNMAKDFIRAISRMIVKALVLKAIKLAAGIGAEGGGLIPSAESGGLIPSFAGGGPVFGNSGPGDNVRANLKGGEFVVRKEAVTPDTAKLLSNINKNGKAAIATPPIVKTGDIVNFTDPNMVRDYLSKNPDAVVNIVSTDVASAGRIRSSMRRTL